MEPLPAITSKPTINTYTTERLSRQGLKDLARLHSAVYGPVAPDHYNAKYDTAYTGAAYIGYIAYGANREPIGYYGVIPCCVRYGEQVILAAQSADTMTHPGYRLKGMFVELSSMTFDLCKALDILLLFGFPNENSYHGAVTKLKWQPVNQMSYFNIPVAGLHWATVAQKVKISRKLYGRYITAVKTKYLSASEGIPNTVINDGFAGIERSPTYHQYKRKSSRSMLIVIGNATIRISIRQSLLVGDMEGVDDQNFISVINELKRFSRRLGIGSIQFHCSSDTILHRLFEKTYTPSPSYHVLFQDFGSAVPPEKLRFTFADVDSF